MAFLSHTLVGLEQVLIRVCLLYVRTFSIGGGVMGISTDFRGVPPTNEHWALLTSLARSNRCLSGRPFTANLSLSRG